mmetsp:Transcript_64048/g.111612  ORF Transcript_64048/g.111612 Transcript_64048/m.111612 type:complete len:363 (+) Transcript_64048:287-1375(+)
MALRRAHSFQTRQEYSAHASFSGSHRRGRPIWPRRPAYGREGALLHQPFRERSCHHYHLLATRCGLHLEDSRISPDRLHRNAHCEDGLQRELPLPVCEAFDSISLAYIGSSRVWHLAVSQVCSGEASSSPNGLRIWVEVDASLSGLFLLARMLKHGFDVLLCSLRRDHRCVHSILLRSAADSPRHAFQLVLAPSNLWHRLWVHGHSSWHFGVLYVWFDARSSREFGPLRQGSVAAVDHDGRGERKIRSCHPLVLAVLDLCSDDARMVTRHRGYCSFRCVVQPNPTGTFSQRPGIVLRECSRHECSSHLRHQRSRRRRHPSNSAAQTRPHCIGRCRDVWRQVHITQRDRWFSGAGFSVLVRQG